MKDQRNNIKRLFQSRPKEWISLPEIMQYAAQYNARILELRRSGMNIPAPKVEVINGVKHTWYMYIPQEKQVEMFV